MSNEKALLNLLKEKYLQFRETGKYRADEFLDWLKEDFKNNA